MRNEAMVTNTNGETDKRMIATRGAKYWLGFVPAIDYGIDYNPHRGHRILLRDWAETFIEFQDLVLRYHSNNPEYKLKIGNGITDNEKGILENLVNV